MRDTKTLYARLPAALVRLINARAKALNSGYRSSKAYLEEGMKRFLARSPWHDSAPCFPIPRDVRTYGGGQTDWVAYNLILSRDVADMAGDAASHQRVSKPSFILGALLWWLEQSLGETGVSPSRADLVAIAARHGLPLWSTPGGNAETQGDSTLAVQKPQRKAQVPDKPVRFKSADKLDILVNGETLAQIDEVIRDVEGRSKSGRLVAAELLSAIDSLGAEVEALGPDAEGTKIECVGQYIGEADPAVRYYATAASIEYRSDKSWYLVKVVRKVVRAREGGKTALKYIPRGRVALGMLAGRALRASPQQLPALIRKRFANDDLHFWVGLMHVLVLAKSVSIEQATELLLWGGARTPDGAARLREAFEALLDASYSKKAKDIISAMFLSNSLEADRIPSLCEALWNPKKDAVLSEDLEGKIALTDLPAVWEID